MYSISMQEYMEEQQIAEMLSTMLMRHSSKLLQAEMIFWKGLQKAFLLNRPLNKIVFNQIYLFNRVRSLFSLSIVTEI